MSVQHRFQRIKIVFHPASGRGRGSRRATQLAQRLAGAGIQANLLDVSSLPSARIAAQLAEADAVVVVGGDGLLHHVVQVLAGTGIPLGIIPAGSGNDTWRMLRDANPAQSMDRVASFLGGGTAAHPVDLLEVEFDETPHRTRLVVGAISWGFEATVNARANRLPRGLGSLRYVVALPLCLPRLSAFDTRVAAKGLDYRGPALAASIANIRSLGGGITLFASAEFDDGLADLSLVGGGRIAPVLRYVPRILAGREHPFRVSARAKEFRVGAAGDCYADGERLGRGALTVRVVPGALPLMR
ncbi:diacylglycerol/lipid kinase family protein [Glutamicibacter protophormiae]|uniref:diacylglycerol/lipid kinase family protein n=1 Tax=Glutamicibacter protophormiae TaxID=37930 RepID=UPI003A93DA50